MKGAAQLKSRVFQLNEVGISGAIPQALDCFQYCGQNPQRAEGHLVLVLGVD